MKKSEVLKIYGNMKRSEKQQWAKECEYSETKGLYRYLNYNTEDYVNESIIIALSKIVTKARLLELKGIVEEGEGLNYLKKLKEKWDNCEDLIKSNIETENGTIIRSIIKIVKINGKPVIVYPVVDRKGRDTEKFEIAYEVEK